MRRDDAGQSGRELGPQRDFAVPFVGEIEKLRDDLRSALFRVELRWFQDRAVPLHEAVTARDLPPFRENIISAGAVVRKKVTKTGQWLHWGHGKGRPGRGWVTNSKCG